MLSIYSFSWIEFKNLPNIRINSLKYIETFNLTKFDDSDTWKTLYYMPKFILSSICNLEMKASVKVAAIIRPKLAKKKNKKTTVALSSRAKQIRRKKKKKIKLLKRIKSNDDKEYT